MSSNDKPLEVRIAIGKEAESIILDEVNRLCPIVVDGRTLTAFTASTPEEDMHQKIDAWVYDEHEGDMSVQIKHRESGRDLGIAVIMPYEGDYWFCSTYKARDELHFDRDMVNTPDYYLVANDTQICVAPGRMVKLGVNAILSSLFNNGGFGGSNTYTYPALDGLELKLVKDRGAGYSAGQQKVICYIKLDALAKRGAYLGQR